MTYNELYPNSLSDGNGLISLLSMLSGIPWSECGEGAHLERAFNLLHGQKQVLSRLESVVTKDMASIIATMFGEKWTKLWNAYKKEYNITDAYLVIEEGSEQRLIDKTENLLHGHEVSENSTDAGTITNSGNSSEDTNANVYGFNSIAPSPSEKTGVTGTDSNTETRNLSGSRTVNNAGTDTTTNKDEENVTRSLNKHGNIGYTTPQKLISEEIKLWGQPYFASVFLDISRFLFYQVY